MAKSNVTEEMVRLCEQRWTTEDARRVLAACDGSGLSVAAFAREHGLKHQPLSWWRKRLGEWAGSALAAAAGTPRVRFVPAIEQGSRAAASWSDGSRRCWGAAARARGSPAPGCACSSGS